MKSTTHRTLLIVAAITVIVLTSLHAGLTAQASTHSAYRWWYWLRPGVYAKYALFTLNNEVIFLEWRIVRITSQGFIVKLMLLEGKSLLESVEVLVDERGYMHNISTGQVLGVWTLLRAPRELVPGKVVKLCISAPPCPLQGSVVNASKSGYLSFADPFIKLLIHVYGLDVRRLTALDVYLWRIANASTIIHRLLKRCPSVNETSIYGLPPGLPSLKMFVKLNKNVFTPLCTAYIYDPITGLALAIMSDEIMLMPPYSCLIDDVLALLRVPDELAFYASSIHDISLGTYIKLLNLSIEQAARILGVSPSVLRSELNRFHSSGLLVSTNVFKVFRERVRVATVSVGRGTAPIAVSTWVAVGVGVAIVIGVVVTIYAVRRRR